MAYLEKARPRVLFLSFNDTDSWAHEGRYDRLLDAYAMSDRWLEELWTWLQAQPDYRGRTHLLITTDHGRGHDGDGWRHHGEKYPDAERVWMAFVSPKMAQRGEWRGGPAVKTSQIAATLASWSASTGTRITRAGKPMPLSAAPHSGPCLLGGVQCAASMDFEDPQAGARRPRGARCALRRAADAAAIRLRFRINE